MHRRQGRVLTHDQLRTLLQRKVDPLHKVLTLVVQAHVVLRPVRVLRKFYQNIRAFHGTKYVGVAPLDVMGGPGLTKLTQDTAKPLRPVALTTSDSP
jgi:hypothetical protein